MEAEVEDGFFQGEEGFGLFGVGGWDARDSAFAGGAVSIVFEEEMGVSVGLGDKGDGVFGFEVWERLCGVELGRRFG